VTILYGISNCDTVRKARNWLDAHGIAHRFHDFRADGLTAARVAAWVDARGWDALLNRRSTTWRQLDADLRAAIGAATAPALLLAQPTLIRRPVLEHEGAVYLGFDPEQYRLIFRAG
jgi:Spx/MgsR family transcriptional regulator